VTRADAPGPLGRLLKPGEVADILRVSVSTVRKLTRRGDLPPVYIGRIPRYHEVDVTAYLDHQRAHPGGRP
jgi:excisionase family DNA binding protein